MKELFQKWFNTAYRGLRDQGFERSLHSNGFCAYLEEYYKRKCALGHCIPEGQYRKEFDDVDPASPTEASKMFDKVVRLIYGGEPSLTVEAFFVNLQNAHDLAETPEGMKMRLTNVAHEYGLTIPE